MMRIILEDKVIPFNLRKILLVKMLQVLVKFTMKYC